MVTKVNNPQSGPAQAADGPQATADREQMPPLRLSLAEQAMRSGPVWSLAHLRLCWTVIVTFGLVLAAAGLLFSGGGAAVGAGVGTLIVGLFFTVSTVIIAKAGQKSMKLVMPTALGTYVLKIVALGVVMVVIPKDGYLDTRWMAAAVGLGVFVWLGAHMRYVWTAKIMYVDAPAPSAAPAPNLSKGAPERPNGTDSA